MSKENDSEIITQADQSGSAAPASEPVISGFKTRSASGLIFLGTLAMLTVAGVGLHSIQTVFGPIFLTLTLILAVRPLGQWMLRKNLPAGLASMTTMVVVLVLLVAMVGITIWSLTPVPDVLMGYSSSFESTVNSALDLMDKLGMETEDFSTYLDDLNFNSIVSWAWTIVDSLSSAGGFLMLVVVAVFFITLDTTDTKVRGKIVRAANSDLANALGGFERRVRHYWIISTVFGLIVAIIDGAVLQFMGIPLAWTWAYWAFVTNYVPNIGFIIGVIPPMLMGLLDQGWQTMIWVLVLYSVVNVIIQTFIQPKFTGDVVGLSPTVTFISLMLWTVIVGPLGSILAIPLTLFVKALLVDSDPQTRWLEAYLVSESDAIKRARKGHYDVTESDTDPQLLGGDMPEPKTKVSPKRISGLARQLKVKNVDKSSPKPRKLKSSRRGEEQ
ncbi:MAG: AI-2E family transporter [Trueperella sp.]|nr:AI-2E family transporter [Trueperella sp.]